MRTLLCLSLLLFSALSAHAFNEQKKVRLTPTPIAIEIKAKPFSFFIPKSYTTDTTKVTFHKAVTLSAPNADAETFGGYSSLHMSKNGDVLTLISDRGTWASAKIEHTQNSLTFNNATTAALMSAKGGSLHWWSGDAEAIDVKKTKACVGFERLHRVACYRFDPTTGRLSARQSTNRLTFLDRVVPDNKAVESVVMDVNTSLGHGDLIILETPMDNTNGEATAYMLSGKNNTKFTIKTHENFAITDATKWGKAQVLLLERRISLLGPQMRISSLDLGTLKTDTINTPKLIFATGIGSPIDNMEGLTTYTDAQGRTHIVTVSDDNFSKWQSTILIDMIIETIDQKQDLVNNAPSQ